MYGENPKGEAIARRALYTLSTCPNPVELIIHPTYGLRGTEVIENFQYDGTRDGKEVSAEFAHHIRNELSLFQTYACIAAPLTVFIILTYFW